MEALWLTRASRDLWKDEEIDEREAAQVDELEALIRKQDADHKAKIAELTGADSGETDAGSAQNQER